VWPAVSDVVHDAASKQQRLLAHQANLRSSSSNSSANTQSAGYIAKTLCKVLTAAPGSPRQSAKHQQQQQQQQQQQCKHSKG
jgi:hypothetical protein